MTKVMRALAGAGWAEGECGQRGGEQCGIHVDGHRPCECHGKLPLLLLDGRLDVARGKVVRKIDVQLDILEMGGVIHHIQYEAVLCQSELGGVTG